MTDTDRITALENALTTLTARVAALEQPDTRTARAHRDDTDTRRATASIPVTAMGARPETDARTSAGTHAAPDPTPPTPYLTGIGLLTGLDAGSITPNAIHLSGFGNGAFGAGPYPA